MLVAEIKAIRIRLRRDAAAGQERRPYGARNRHPVTDALHPKTFFYWLPEGWA